MFTFATILILCCFLLQVEPAEKDHFESDYTVRAAWLQQFGYIGSSQTVPVGINVLPEHAKARSEAGDDELEEMNNIAPEVVRKLQLYAGVEQTGVFDDETIGMMVTPRCQNPDIMDENNGLARFFLGQGQSRWKRDARSGSTPKWEKLELTFSFENTTPQNSQAREVISSAFAAWAECSKLSFTMVDISQSPDITVRFATWRHDPPEDCSFDGPEGVKAHAFYPPLGMAHFDDDEDWSNNCVLYSVALHEIGHLLGLGHSFHKNSIMFAYFNTEFVKSRCEGDNTRPLAVQDIDNIRGVYGWESCDKAEDPEPTVPPSPSEGPGKLDDLTSSSSMNTLPTEEEETSSPTTAGPQTTNTFSGSLPVTYNPVTGGNSWQLFCGEMDENILSSPYYPDIYPNGMDCTWTIRIPPGMRAVSMHFIKFELEDGGEECLFDYLQITEEDGTSTKLCGVHTQSLTFESKSLTLNFVSDSLKQEAGFKILFIYEAEPQKCPCRAVLSEAEGVVTHNHPDLLLDTYEECIYHINSTDPNKQILIIVDDIADHCSKYDLLESEEEGEESLIGNCREGETGVKYFTSTNGAFFIKFRPGESGSFAVRYYMISEDGAGCSSTGTQDYNKAFLRSRSWYPQTNRNYMYFPNTDCILYIPRNTEGKELIIEIDTMGIEQDKNCSYDFVEVYVAENDGPQRECGERRPTERIEFRTLGDTLVYFHSDGSVQSTGFMLSYRVVECVHELDYSDNLIRNDVSLEGDCSYQFEFESNQKTFACFDFSSSVRTESGRCAGNIEVPGPTDHYSQYRSDRGGSRAGKYCNSFSTLLDRTDNVIKVSGGGSETGMGHVAIHNARGCYQKITVDSRFKSIEFRPPRNKRCMLHFVGLPGYRLIVSFSHVNLKRGCSREPIELYQANKGCSGRIKICKKMFNMEVNSDEAFLMAFMTEKKSNVRVKVRQQWNKVSSSVCPESCADPAIDGPTSSPTSVSTSSFEIREDLDEQSGYNRDHKFGGLPGGWR